MKRGLIVALRRLAQIISACLALARTILLAPFLAAGLLIYPQVLRKEFYRSANSPGWFRSSFPTIHFLFKGAWELRDPHPAFSQEAIARDYPRLRLQPPVLNHVLNPLAERDMPLLSDRPDVPGPAEPMALSDIWALFETDAAELSREISSITPTKNLKKTLCSRVLDPSPRNLDEHAVVLRLLDRLPASVDHLFLVPWLGIKGGAERLSERYLAFLGEHYPSDRWCVLAPDAIHSHSGETRSINDVRVFSINAEMPHADLETRVRILDRLLVNLRPACVHNAGSMVAWLAFRDHAARYGCDMKLFVNLFSDIRIEDEVPVGYYHNFLPYVIDHISGVLCDNRSIIGRAITDFALTQDEAAKFHYVPTPLLGLDGEDPRLGLRSYKTKGTGRSLWMSRIAQEKRIDVLNAIAGALPDRHISVYGATLPGSVKADMSLFNLPNIAFNGEFEHLSDLPVADFDSYIFTSGNEGMPISVLEATMLGLPVVAPDVGGIGEFINAHTGWLVSSPDAIDEYVGALIEIEQNPEEAASRVAAAQERLVEFHSLPKFKSILKRIPGYLQVDPP